MNITKEQKEFLTRYRIANGGYLLDQDLLYTLDSEKCHERIIVNDIYMMRTITTARNSEDVVPDLLDEAFQIITDTEFARGTTGWMFFEQCLYSERNKDLVIGRLPELSNDDLRAMAVTSRNTPEFLKLLKLQFSALGEERFSQIDYLDKGYLKPARIFALLEVYPNAVIRFPPEKILHSCKTRQIATFLKFFPNHIDLVNNLTISKQGELAFVCENPHTNHPIKDKFFFFDLKKVRESMEAVSITTTPYIRKGYAVIRPDEIGVVGDFLVVRKPTSRHKSLNITCRITTKYRYANMGTAVCFELCGFAMFLYETNQNYAIDETFSFEIVKNSEYDSEYIANMVGAAFL